MVDPDSPDYRYRVHIHEADYADGSLPAVVDEILAAFPLSLDGKTVLVKPNILAGHPPEAGVTTHPALVAAVVTRLQAAGATVLVGDNPGVFGYGRSEKAAEVSGIKAAAGDCFIQLGRTPVRKELPNRDVGYVMIAGDVLDVDLVINLPKLKTHGLTYYTGALKNTFGYVVGGDKMRVHHQAPTPRRFAAALVDIYALRPPDLTIMDAVLAMEGNGPSNGRVRRLGKILASDNAVCLDAVAVALAGKKPAVVPHLKIAAEQGLGTIDLEEIERNVELVPAAGFKMPATYVPGLMGIVLNRFLSRWINCLPVVHEERCKRCGLCVDHCPTGAMTMAKGGFPQADKDRCISCYCCQEMCPEDAIELTGRFIRLLRGSPRRAEK
ncbi:MAG: DUF362 domain-containing protein [Desulfosudaceae bacterium]